MKLSVRELVIAGMLMAVSVVLSYPMFKLMGSIGLDAIPAYFAAAVMGPAIGGVVGGFAHIISAILTGFPFSVPVHLVVMILMFLTCYLYGAIRVRFNRYIAVAVAITVNGPVTLLVSAYMAQYLGASFAGMMMFTALIGPLTLASAVNVIVAEVLATLIGGRITLATEDKRK